MLSKVSGERLHFFGSCQELSVKGMGRGNDGRDAVLLGQAAHFVRFRLSARAIVDVRQQMTVSVNHLALCKTTLVIIGQVLFDHTSRSQAPPYMV